MVLDLDYNGCWTRYSKKKANCLSGSEHGNKPLGYMKL